MATSKNAVPKKAAPLRKSAAPVSKKTAAPRRKPAIKQSQEPNPLELRMDRLETLLGNFFDTQRKDTDVIRPIAVQDNCMSVNAQAESKKTETSSFTDLLKGMEITNDWMGSIVGGIHDRLDLLSARKDELASSLKRTENIAQAVADALNRLHNTVG